MSTYYEYRDVMVMIAHKLMNIDGWKVYGYHADESDSMTDYYSPAYWDGVAEKNGYILCVNVYGAREPEEIRKYNYDGKLADASISEKIKKLEQMTVERGASESEAETAKNMIVKLQAKQTGNTDKYIVIGMIPGHLANPPRCNWHVEKDGIIIAKGNGLLKYAVVNDYYRYDYCFEDLNKWKADEEKYIADFIRDNRRPWNDTEERSRECALSRIAQLKKDDAIIQQFEAFINKIDTTCGGLLGEGDGVVYEKIKVTEYKKEIKAFETTNGSLRDGQCFILKSNFNYGRYKGLVYRIREIGEEDKKYFTAYKLNGKLTKECHGLASQNNTWYIGTADTITKWVDKGTISWCELQEVKTPYEVEKVVKKTIKAEKKPVQKSTTGDANETSTIIDDLHFEVSEDVDTRTNEKIYLVKVSEKLSREEYLEVNKYIKSLGGYYSKFKHAFLFKEDPSDLLNGESVEPIQAEQKEQKQREVEQVSKEKMVNIINKQIDSLQKKIDSLSGEYKTNTWKRMNEQASRDSKTEGYQKDIDTLRYLLDALEDRELTPLEENLSISSFRNTIHSYYDWNEAHNSKERISTARPISYPQIDYNCPLDGWYNKEVPTKQKRLQKAGINNTQDLLKAVEEYKMIHNAITRPANSMEKKIKQLERKYKMRQKGDINFTPSEVAKQLIEYARIDSNSTVLEPSAGIGNIADQIKQYTNNIDVCEQMYDFAELLKLKGYNVVGSDFLQYETSEKYDAIIMNPPFSDEQNHIKHAYDLLKEGGTLVSVTSHHWTFAGDKKAIEFRTWLDGEVYYTRGLQSGTFEMTNVASKILIIEKNSCIISKMA